MSSDRKLGTFSPCYLWTSQCTKCMDVSCKQANPGHDCCSFLYPCQINKFTTLHNNIVCVCPLLAFSDLMPLLAGWLKANHVVMVKRNHWWLWWETGVSFYHRYMTAVLWLGICCFWIPAHYSNRFLLLCQFPSFSPQSKVSNSLCTEVISQLTPLLSWGGCGEACATSVTDGMTSHVFSPAAGEELHQECITCRIFILSPQDHPPSPPICGALWLTMRSHNSTLTGLFQSDLLNSKTFFPQRILGIHRLQVNLLSKPHLWTIPFSPFYKLLQLLKQLRKSDLFFIVPLFHRIILQLVMKHFVVLFWKML